MRHTPYVRMDMHASFLELYLWRGVFGHFCFVARITADFGDVLVLCFLVFWHDGQLAHLLRGWSTVVGLKQAGSVSACQHVFYACMCLRVYTMTYALGFVNDNTVNVDSQIVTGEGDVVASMVPLVAAATAVETGQADINTFR